MTCVNFMSVLKTKIERVFAFLKTIPPGTVVTYREVAKRCGLSNARHVGWILQRNDDPKQVPCHRVVRSDGRLATGYKFGGHEAQRKRLVNEGVVLDARGRIRAVLRMAPA